MGVHAIKLDPSLPLNILPIETKKSAVDALRTQHRPTAPIISTVEVAKGWHIHVEESGNPHGIPAVFVHGGPGVAFNPKDCQWFDPEKYRIIVFQQRGTYHCTPSAMDLATDANIFKDITIQTLAEDIEVLKKHLGIEKWLVFGGSWGSTLSLYYAQQFPASCSGVVVRGIYLGTHKENEMLFSEERLKRLAGKDWEPAVLKRIEEYAKSKGVDIDMCQPQTIYEAYRKLVVEKNDFVAARIWKTYEDYVDEPGNQENLHRLLSDDVTETTPEERSIGVWETQMFDTVPKMVNLLDESRMQSLKDIPVKVVQGKKDNLCCYKIAEKLVDGIRSVGGNVSFDLVENGAHTPYHPEMTDALIRATDNFALKQSFEFQG